MEELLHRLHYILFMHIIGFCMVWEAIALSFSRLSAAARSTPFASRGHVPVSAPYLSDFPPFSHPVGSAPGHKKGRRWRLFALWCGRWSVRDWEKGVQRRWHNLPWNPIEDACGGGVLCEPPWGVAPSTLKPLDMFWATGSLQFPGFVCICHFPSHRPAATFFSGRVRGSFIDSYWLDAGTQSWQKEIACEREMFSWHVSLFESCASHTPCRCPKEDLMKLIRDTWERKKSPTSGLLLDNPHPRNLALRCWPSEDTLEWRSSHSQ